MWIFASFLLAISALIVAGIALRTAHRAYAQAAKSFGLASSLETSERLTPSKLAELAEFREALDRAEHLLVKVNRREIARAKARGDDGVFVKPNGAGTLKDQLRMRAGLRAGQPAPHQ